MPYTPTVWQDGVTPVNAVNLNKLENGLAAAVGIPADTVVTAANFLIRNKLLVGDTQPAYRFLGDGKHEWGPGGSTAADLTLSRLAAGIMSVGGELRVTNGFRCSGTLSLESGCYIYSGANALGVGVLLSRATGDVDNRFTLSNDGTHYWGDGTAAPDVTLNRSAVGTLGLGGSLSINGQLNTLAQVTINANGAGVSALYITQLANDGFIIAERRAADSQWVFLLGAGGQMNWGPGGATLGPDTNLYRMSTGTLKTDGILYVGGAAVVDHGGAGAKLYFGTALDTTLYRASAAILKTDGTLEVGVGVKFPGGGVQTAPAPDISFEGDWAAGTYQDGDVVVKDGVAFLCVNGPTAVAPDSSLWGLAATYPTIGTALPGSPVDGQEFILTDSLTAPTYAWTFKYVAGISDANKWVFIGGSPAVSETSTDSTVGSATYVDPTSTVVSITVPRAGVYIIDYGYTVTGLNTADTFQWYGSPKIGAAATLDADAAGWFLGTSSGNAGGGSPSRWQRKTLAASDLIKMQYRGNGATSKTLDSQFLKITPVRIA